MMKMSCNQLSDVLFNYAIDVLRVHPKHWTMFANFPAFNKDQYLLLRKVLINNFLMMKSISSLMHDLVKNLEGRTSTDEINNLQSVQKIQQFFKYHHLIVMNNSSRETYYHLKIISENIPQQHRHCTWTTNSAEGKDNSQIHNQSQNTSPPNSVLLLLQDYNNKIDTLLRKYKKMQPYKTPAQFHK